MIRNPEPLTENAIREIADQINIPLLGIINADPILEMLPYEKQRRKENHGMIPFVRTKPERRIDFKTVMPEVKSVIVIGIPYPLFSKKIDDKTIYGYFSSVTCGMDYHQVVMAKMDELCKRIQFELSADVQYKKFVDNSRLMDKASAWKAGLGFFGKNNLLIHPQFGSAWNIGQILVNKEITHEEHPPIENQCGQCQRCIKACPGHALGERGHQLFYERCISYLTQKKNLTESEEERIQYFLYGCDICQWVCPFNKRGRENLELDSRVRFDEILRMSEEESKSKFANRALSWLPASVLRRNAGILKNRSKTSFNDIITNNINAKEKILMVRVRFAPSPTGNVHVGSLRTALYNYLFAKQNDGTFVLRLEDTDRTRYQEGSVENLLNALYTTGVVPDEGLQLVDGVPVENGEYGPYIQSERLEIYKKYIQQLIDEGKAYYCFCSIFSVYIFGCPVFFTPRALTANKSIADSHAILRLCLDGFHVMFSRVKITLNFNIVFTSNKTPSTWRSNFNEDDSLLCALDRIFDDATVFNIKGDSYRGKRLETVTLQTGRVMTPHSAELPIS